MIIGGSAVELMNPREEKKEKEKKKEEEEEEEEKRGNQTNKQKNPEGS